MALIDLLAKIETRIPVECVNDHGLTEWGYFVGEDEMLEIKRNIRKTLKEGKQ